MANEITKVTDQNGVDHPFKDVAAFPRSEQRVLGAKNVGEIILGYYVQEATTGQFKLTADTNAITYIAKVEQNTEYRCKKLASGDRFAVTGFVNYPSKTTTTTEASILFDDSSATEHVVNTGIYNYLAFTANRTTEVAESSVKGMIYLASDPDPTYAPPTMTNRALTEKVAYLGEKTGVTTGSISVPNNSFTQIAQVTVPKGPCLIHARACIDAESTAYEIALSISSSSSSSSTARNRTVTGVASTITATGIGDFLYLNNSTETIEYLWFKHNKGEAVTVYPTFEVIQL